MPVEPPIETPASLADAYAVLAASTDDAPITPIAGGTDIMVRITGEIGEPPARMVDLSRLAELRGITVDGDAVILGATTTYTEIRRSDACREHLPALVEAAATIGAAQIQNRGTLGGNIANASPAGDTLPVLLALDAAIVVGGARGERTIPADEFWVAYRRTALAPDELILRIRIPVTGGREARFRKIGTRRAQAISKVVLALAWREGGTGPRRPWSDVRLALGSVADRPIRARATEGVLEGSAPTPETADGAAEALAAEIHPIDDVRSTADYRRVVASRALHRMIRDAGGW
ncbi:MAG TPA: xanthine dehydrogenase family protein subunit M [Candidatus Limnocylindrales bacterium]|nr:xanthine dehydrogenase family protein subunit M [Candidatus Limnocylindrales bacterium]